MMSLDGTTGKLLVVVTKAYLYAVWSSSHDFFNSAAGNALEGLNRGHHSLALFGRKEKDRRVSRCKILSRKPHVG